MKAYSVDPRERVVAAVDAGEARPAIARLFRVSLATIKRYLQRRRATGGLLPGQSPGRTPELAPAQYPARARARACIPTTRWRSIARRGGPSRARRRRSGRCGGRSGVPGSRAKKSLVAAERDEAKRAAWRADAAPLAPGGPRLPR